MAKEPSDILNMYLDGKIYIFEKQWIKKPTRIYVYPKHRIEQGTILQKTLNA